jgi:hypothetical protein
MEFLLLKKPPESVPFGSVISPSRLTHLHLFLMTLSNATLLAISVLEQTKVPPKTYYIDFKI